MAAPPEIKLSDLSGDWVMNKTLSDDTDAVLALQGIGWLTRRAISWATVTLHVKQYLDTENPPQTHIDIDQTVTGGIKGTTELRTLDWVERSHTDHMFGTLVGQSAWLSLSSPLASDLDEYLKDGWLMDGEESGPEGERLILAVATNKERGWEAKQIWGFAIVDGKRFYTRRVVVTKGEETLKVRLVYDWQGKPK